MVEGNPLKSLTGTVAITYYSYPLNMYYLVFLKKIDTWNEDDNY